MANSAAHRTLNTPELLDLVFAQFGDPQTDASVGSDLVACACVSSRWSSCAIPIIWNSCKGAAAGLFSLLGTLSAPKGGPLRFRSSSITSKSARWARFLHYMQQMKTLQLFVMKDYDADLDVSAQRLWLHSDVISTALTIAQSRGQVLFSSIQHWTFRLREPELCDLLVYLIHGQTTSVTLDYFGGQAAADVSRFSLLFSRMETICPSISALHLECPYSSTPFLPTELAAMLPSLTRLKTLTLPPDLHPTVWQATTDLPLISFGFSHDFPLQSAIQPVTSFPTTLASLELCLKYEHVFDFLAAPPSDAIENLCLVVNDTPRQNETADFFSQIPTLAPKLQSLSIALRNHDRSPLSATGWFEPLQRLHSLTVLDLYSDAFETVGDAYLRKLFEACPQLRELKLRPMPIDKVSTTATLQTLATIARMCRQIEQVTIRLDCRDSFPMSPDTWVSFSPTLVSLNMEYSPLRSPSRVAGIMIHLFRTRTIPITSGPSKFGRVHERLFRLQRVANDYAPLWTEVSDTLRNFRKVLDSSELHETCQAASETRRLVEENERLRRAISELKSKNAALRAAGGGQWHGGALKIEMGSADANTASD